MHEAARVAWLTLRRSCLEHSMLTLMSGPSTHGARDGHVLQIKDSLGLWKDPDPDAPAYREAKAEFAALLKGIARTVRS